MPESSQSRLPESKRRRERKSGKTEYCGVSSERIMTPKKAARGKGEFICIICDSRFSRRVGVNYHFPGCVRKYGNPLGNSWDDHGSCKDPKDLDEAPANYDPRTIATDFLRALGEHPTLSPLNAHMEGRRPNSEPLAPASVHPQDREHSVQATRPTSQQRPPQNQADERKRAGHEAPIGQEGTGREDGGSGRIARTEAVEESTTPTQMSQPAPGETRNDNGTPSETHHAPQLGALQTVWTMHRFDTGVPYFVDYSTGSITVDDPQVVPHPRAMTRLGGLPDGWEMRFVSTTSSDPRVYFVDHNTRRNTWDDPRGPSVQGFQLEEL